jgi:D-glycero-D-manno-heptose 1,7-bisphosphate phosphatase
MAGSHALRSQRAIFLDRDGVINANRADHVTSWAQFQFLPGALQALRLLTVWGYRIFVVTNQAAVGRGLMTATTLDAIHNQMTDVAALHGARITAVRACPHRPEAQCACRKPQPGMLLSLAAEMAIDLPTTYFVGDALTDVIAGKAAGCRTILVRTGRGMEQLAHPEWAHYQPDHIAADLLEAVRLIEHGADISQQTHPHHAA